MNCSVPSSAADLPRIAELQAMRRDGRGLSGGWGGVGADWHRVRRVRTHRGGFARPGSPGDRQDGAGLRANCISRHDIDRRADLRQLDCVRAAQAPHPVIDTAMARIGDRSARSSITARGQTCRALRISWMSRFGRGMRPDCRGVLTWTGSRRNCSASTAPILAHVSPGGQGFVGFGVIRHAHLALGSWRGDESGWGRARGRSRGWGGVRVLRTRRRRRGGGGGVREG